MAPKPPAKPTVTDKVISGAVHAVPCPHCGKANDFRPIRDQMLLVEEAQFDCDYCGMCMEFMGSQSIQVIRVRQSQRFQQRVKLRVPVADARTVALSKVRR